MSEQGDVDFHIISIPIGDDRSKDESLLFLRTNNDRQKEKDEPLCCICYYNSEDEKDEEQEKTISKKNLYQTGRYAQMYCDSGDTPRAQSQTQTQAEVCSHRFHTACLYKWVKSSREFKCPLCRASPHDETTKLSVVPELYGSEPEYIVQYHPNGKIKMECYKENGVKHKFYKKYDLLGNICYECGYHHGDKHGDEIEYHQHSSNKWKIQQYRFGVKNGYYREYTKALNESDEQFVLKHQEWKNGMLHGEEHEWHLASRSKKHQCQYFEGLKHGTEKVWTITGKLFFYKKYEHGRSVGRHIVRFPNNGCIERKCFYNQEGQLHGKYLEWQYGCKSLTKGSEKNEKKSGTTGGGGSGGGAGGLGILGMLTGGALNLGGLTGGGNEGADGGVGGNDTDNNLEAENNVTLKINANYLDGVRVGEYFEYHDNGEIKIQAHYNYDGEYDGEYFEYDRFGKCKLRYLYDNGKLQGLCERYGNNSKVCECGYYQDDLLDGVGCCRLYYPNGRLKAKKSYYRGLLHGESTFYNQKGELIERYFYDRDQLVE